MKNITLERKTMYKIYQSEDGSQYLYDHRTGTFYSIATGSPYHPREPEYWLSEMEVVGEADSLHHIQMNEQKERTMTSTVFTRGSAWSTAELHDGWGGEATDEQVAALAALVVGRFHTLAQDTSVSWFPKTSEVIGDIDDDVTVEQLEEWREQALAEVWAAVTDESNDAELCAAVADIFTDDAMPAIVS